MDDTFSPYPIIERIGPYYFHSFTLVIEDEMQYYRGVAVIGEIDKCLCEVFPHKTDWFIQLFINLTSYPILPLLPNLCFIHAQQLYTIRKRVVYDLRSHVLIVLHLIKFCQKYDYCFPILSETQIIDVGVLWSYLFSGNNNTENHIRDYLCFLARYDKTLKYYNMIKNNHNIDELL